MNYKNDEITSEGFLADSLGCYLAPDEEEIKSDGEGYPEDNIEDKPFTVGGVIPTEDEFMSEREKAMRDLFWL